MTTSLDDPEYWKERAAKARLRAEGMVDESSSLSLLQQALDYDRLADEAAQHVPSLPLHSVTQPNARLVSSERPSTTSRRVSASTLACLMRWPFVRLR